MFEVIGGWAAQTRWQRAGGHGFAVNKPLTPEAILAKWDVITNFGKHVLTELSCHAILMSYVDDGRATHPATTQEAIEQVGLWISVLNVH